MIPIVNMSLAGPLSEDVGTVTVIHVVFSPDQPVFPSAALSKIAGGEDFF